MVFGKLEKMHSWLNFEWQVSSNSSGDYDGQEPYYATQYLLYGTFGFTAGTGYSWCGGSWCVHSGYMERTHNGRMTVARWLKAPFYYGNELSQLAETRLVSKVDGSLSETCGHGCIHMEFGRRGQSLQCPQKPLERGSLCQNKMKTSDVAAWEQAWPRPNKKPVGSQATKHPLVSFGGSSQLVWSHALPYPAQARS